MQSIYTTPSESDHLVRILPPKEGDLNAYRHSFDLHLHTFFSKDAADSHESMIAAAKKKGLSGIAITDHDTCDGVEYLRRKGWIRSDGEAESLFFGSCN